MWRPHSPLSASLDADLLLFMLDIIFCFKKNKKTAFSIRGCSWQGQTLVQLQTEERGTMEKLDSEWLRIGGHTQGHNVIRFTDSNKESC